MLQKNPLNNSYFFKEWKFFSRFLLIKTPARHSRSREHWRGNGGVYKIINTLGCRFPRWPAAAGLPGTENKTRHRSFRSLINKNMPSSYVRGFYVKVTQWAQRARDRVNGNNDRPLQESFLRHAIMRGRMRCTFPLKIHYLLENVPSDYGTPPIRWMCHVKELPNHSLRAATVGRKRKVRERLSGMTFYLHQVLQLQPCNTLGTERQRRYRMCHQTEYLLSSLWVSIANRSVPSLYWLTVRDSYLLS